ncbi:MULTISPECIES: beta-galactosidase [unclassified Duganella]|uniref:beta-galactosidase n=1 Tax=unclassified Duganella TaxID=2636909 RepID=UPI00088D91E2|nr:MULTISPECIES: beta-galactosidase [unclassified Duganella]SDF97738.1 Glycosyl hydrolases family 35 [Duganella sp. OV458]SDJ06932.1 Glycosyl hydrolases family 35 [Duganella sp. OV510]
MSLRLRTCAAVVAAVVAGVLAAAAANADTLSIDASAATPAPLAAALRLGSATAPNGDTLGANARYLTRNGAPWLPIMGEFHYSRTPASQWDAELRKMKAAGIDIVASYVMWNHHEEQEGKFDWSGNRDLRRFIQLASKAGLDVVVRVGPWVHAEVRYGGIPDWVVNTMPSRGNDPQYMAFVDRLYQQIGQQLKGQLWKDGGRVIGIQLENEYNIDGPGKGAAHISALKKLALKAGMDVPYYTVTGWDGTIYPAGEVTPVFGGYPDEPWGVSTKELPPKETYAFRFDTRVSGDLGAQTAAHAPGTAETDKEVTPFLGAEYGGGLPFMYRRRTVVSADDIASMLPVQLGSGVNLMGYYMFHGGRNPLSIGGTGMEESTLSGGYNDTTMISYDFQAPLGPDGQQRKVLEKLRPFHLFTQAFGSRLAPMTVRKPEVSPAKPDDLKTARFAVRSEGDRGFLFVNNHVRQYPMAAQKATQFAVKLPGQSITLPSKPVDIADGAYFIWPLNLDLDGTNLHYATAQPVTLLDQGKAGMLAVFAASAGVPVELSFDAGAKLAAPGAQIATVSGHTLVTGVQPGAGTAVTVQRAGKRPLTIVVLTPEQSQQLSVVQLAGQKRLLLSADQAYADGNALQLRSVGDSKFRFAVYPALASAPKATSTGAAWSAPAAKASAAAARAASGAPSNAGAYAAGDAQSATVAVQAAGNDGIFQVFEATLPAREVKATVTQTREAQEAAPITIGGNAKSAIQPLPENFKAAGAWQINVPREQLKGLDDALLQIDFVGDIGRLYSGTRMLDDWYYSGYQWQFGLKQQAALLDQPLTVSVLPLRADAPIYLPKEARPDFGGAKQMATVRGVTVIPVYQLRINP